LVVIHVISSNLLIPNGSLHFHLHPTLDGEFRHSCRIIWKPYCTLCSSCNVFFLIPSLLRFFLIRCLLWNPRRQRSSRLVWTTILISIVSSCWYFSSVWEIRQWYKDQEIIPNLLQCWIYGKMVLSNVAIPFVTGYFSNTIEVFVSHCWLMLWPSFYYNLNFWEPLFITIVDGHCCERNEILVFKYEVIALEWFK